MSVFRDDVLEGQVALITGGGSGICLEITRKFMAHGCDTVIISRSQERLDEAAKQLSEETGRRCLPLSADVREMEKVEGAIDAALKHYGRIDIVVNGAAGNFLCPAAKLSSNAFRTVLEIDTLGTYNVSRAAFDKALRVHGGSILNISATLHYAGQALQVHPGVAKAGIDAMTRHLAVEWGPAKIRVNAISPGPIGDTEGMRRLMPPGMKEDLERRITLKRFGRSEEIADAALFLSSDAAQWITGSILVVDGGSWMTTNNVWP